MAARDDAPSLERLFEALVAIDYPPDRLRLILVDDFSSDDSTQRLESFVAGRERVEAILLDSHVGKAQALNRALAAARGADLVVVCDADVRPRPDCLRRLSEAFADERVAAAAAFLAPSNAAVTLVSRYAALESWVHQLITSAGKDRLRLNPPTLGGCAAYRRSALDAIGGFGSCSAPGEDVRTSAALTLAGWDTGFVLDAVADNRVAQSWLGYLWQHVRWARNVYSATAFKRVAYSPVDRLAPGVRDHAPAGARMALARRSEVLLSGSGYADRLLLIVMAMLAPRERSSRWAAGCYLAVRMVETSAASNCRRASIRRPNPAPAAALPPSPRYPCRSGGRPWPRCR